eukprot:12547532-Prorocentrum_lima.AAC.1
MPLDELIREVGAWTTVPVFGSRARFLMMLSKGRPPMAMAKAWRYSRQLCRHRMARFPRSMVCLRMCDELS